MRLSTTEIIFIGNGHQAAGTYANVAVATFVKAGGSGEEGRRVAVKMFRFIMREDMTEEKFLRVFVNEVRLLDKLSHPNIAKIIGFVEEVEKSIAWLVSSWEENRNLREFLRSGTWEMPERVSLIADVASGLVYLHTRQPPISDAPFVQKFRTSENSPPPYKKPPPRPSWRLSPSRQMIEGNWPRILAEALFTMAADSRGGLQRSQILEGGC
ncbi:hypothetical protein FS837_007170, partial [Tulasnella sp. UAMH 9824]